MKSLILLLAAYLATHCLTVNELMRRFPVSIWVIVSGALLLSNALTSTGLIQLLVSSAVQDLTADKAIWLMIVCYFLTLFLTELVTNNAAAALVFPVAYGIAEATGLNSMTFVMAVAFGASASFISPYGYQTNLMVYNAGRYRIADYIKAGLPVSLLYSVSVLILLPVIYPL